MTPRTIPSFFPTIPLLGFLFIALIVALPVEAQESPGFEAVFEKSAADFEPALVMNAVQTARGEGREEAALAYFQAIREKEKGNNRKSLCRRGGAALGWGKLMSVRYAWDEAWNAYEAAARDYREAGEPAHEESRSKFSLTSWIPGMGNKDTPQESCSKGESAGNAEKPAESDEG